MSNNENKKAIKNSIMSFIIGDTIGAPVEFAGKEYIIKNPVQDFQEYKYFNQPLGTWTDDTSMTLCTMQSIIDKNGIHVKDLSDKFLKWLETGYMSANNVTFDFGETTYSALKRYSYGRIPSGINNVSANGNGSLMRILPIALYCYFKNINGKKMYKIVDKVSSITHAHKISIIGCYIYCCIIHNILNNHEKDNCFKTNIKEILSEDDLYFLSDYKSILDKSLVDKNNENIFSAGYVADTLKVAIKIFFETNSVEECILKTVNLGGDTDTNAAIAGSLSGLYYGLKNKYIKQEWQYKLRKFDEINKLSDNFIKKIME